MNEKREFEPLRDDQCIVRVNQICIPGVAVVRTFKTFPVPSKFLDSDSNIRL